MAAPPLIHPPLPLLSFNPLQNHHIHLPRHTSHKPTQMASTSALFMAAPVAQNRHLPPSSAAAFLKPLPVIRPSKMSPKPAVGKFQVRASLKEKVVTGLTAAALTASMIAPDAAEAAVSPSLKNFLLSIGYGGVVAVAIVGAIVAVSNFDPVKRG